MTSLFLPGKLNPLFLSSFVSGGNSVMITLTIGAKLHGASFCLSSMLHNISLILQTGLPLSFPAHALIKQTKF